MTGVSRLLGDESGLGLINGDGYSIPLDPFPQILAPCRLDDTNPAEFLEARFFWPTSGLPTNREKARCTSTMIKRRRAEAAAGAIIIVVSEEPPKYLNEL
jgi:hypothetical protein